MAGLGDVDDDTSGSGSDEPPSCEDAGWETPDRRHVDALLDISDEDFLKDLEPFEYHCYPAREEAVSKLLSSYEYHFYCLLYMI